MPRGEETVASDFIDLLAVDDQFGLGDAHRQRLADMPPGNRVKVLPIDDVAFDVDDAVVDDGNVIRRGRQRDQVGELLRMPVEWSLLGLSMNAHVGDIGQPPGGDLVEMFQRAKRPAIQQALFRIIKRPFHLPFRLAAAHAASVRGEAIVRGEGEELGIVERPFIAVPQHHNLHVVVQAGSGHTAQMFKSADVLAQSGRQVLGLDEAKILSA